MTSRLPFGYERRYARGGRMAPATPGAATMPPTQLRIVVHGRPAPQGSKRHVGGGRLIESSARTMPWRQDIMHAAHTALDEHPDTARPLFTGAVALRVVFIFARPQSHYGTGRNAALLRANAPRQPASRGTYDLDKLVRAVCDALTAAGVWGDDSQVADLCTRKTYPSPLGDGIDALTTPGAVITVRNAE